MSDESEAETADEPPAEAEPDESTAEESTEDAAEGIQDGDVVRLAYTMRTAENGTVVDTTDPEVAEEAGLETEGRSIEPRTVVLGEGQLFEAVEDAIVGSEAGDEDSVTVPHDQAFGEYDPDEVETVSTDTIPEESRYPGAQVEVDGRQGVVESVYPGRSRVDFNHPLAGEDLEYDYEILGVVEDRVEKAQGLLNAYFDVDLDMDIRTDEVEEETVVEPDEDAEGDDESDDAEAAEPETEIEVVEKETLYVDSDPQLQFNQQWMFSKQQIAQQLIDLVDVDRVIIQEVIDGQPAGMPGMMGGMGGGGGLGEVEEALEDEEVDAEEVVEELVGDEGEETEE